MVAAYNYKTREARIYAEFKDKICEHVIENYMVGMGAASVRIDSFSLSDWKASSQIAIQSILKCREGGRDFTLLQYGSLAVEDAVENGVQSSVTDANGGGLFIMLCCR